MTTVTQCCTFQVDGLFFGIDVLRVQEVLRYQEMTAVPLSPPIVSGLINLRGQIVTAIDLRRRLGRPDRPAAQMPMNVVVRSGDGVLSLLVDEIGDVIEINKTTFEAPPATVRGTARELVTGVHKLASNLLLILDLDRTLLLPESI